MTIEVRARCDTCRWWGRPHHPDDDLAPCRVNPPARGKQGRGRWPLTDARDWCSEWHGIAEPLSLKDTRSSDAGWRHADGRYEVCED